ncbi:malonyl-CoA decarboxylase [Nisaea sp.]|uniref:malonyl-CoA decarboxylase n=1 Tax=Nisaea sp. TaxID=2024842 RepID=UPI003B51AF12
MAKLRHLYAMPNDQPTSFIDRTLSNLRQAWSGLSDSTRYMITGLPRPELPDEDLERVHQQMEDCLTVRSDEVSVRARAAGLGRTYLALDPTGQLRFLKLLAENYGVDREEVDQAMDGVRSAKDDSARTKAEAILRRTLEPRWRRLLKRFTTLPEGVKFLVDMRVVMLEHARSEPAIKALSDDLQDMLSAWFDVGLLELKQITWESPAAILEKLIAYEAVHEIRSWDDLKNRLDSDRRCFAYFHPAMPDEPLIFVEVALLPDMAANVHDILDADAPKGDVSAATAAIFYSISNAQKGLVGISFGNFLIKRVVEVLQHDFPNLKKFATLSPIPGLAKWSAKTLEENGFELTNTERKALAQIVDGETDGALLADALRRPKWFEDENLSAALKGPVTRLAARYLYSERRPDGKAKDPVAHFHLSNGARMERLNWLGDTSTKGLAQAHGMMINYLYRLSDIESNSGAYSASGKIAVSSSMKPLVRD